MKYFFFKYKSEEAIKDGKAERDSDSQLTLALEEGECRSEPEDLLPGWSFEYGTIN